LVGGGRKTAGEIVKKITRFTLRGGKKETGEFLWEGGELNNKKNILLENQPSATLLQGRREGRSPGASGGGRRTFLDEMTHKYTTNLKIRS